ncbi:MAG: thiol reductant ABC exporter subunit CydD, partial [Anaerolineaceae bacterium]|nr:thiol reductant ABC exporter subunit CydD [Anaerolineaceae bacterium]
MNLMNLDRRLIRQVATARVFFFVAVLAGFAAGIGAVFQARQLSQIITRVFLNGLGLTEVLPALGILLAIVFGRAVVGFLSETAAAAAALKIKENLRNLLVEHILALGPAYSQGERSGELLNTVSQGIEALDAYFSQYLPQVALAGTLPLAYFLVVLPVDPLSAGILLFTGPLIPLFMFLIGHNAEAFTRRQWNALGRMSAYFLDTLQGLAALKALGRSMVQAERIAQVSERYRQTTLSVLRVTFLSALALELLGTMGTAIIAVQIGLRLLYGQIGFELAFFILLLAPDFYLPLRALGLRFHASMSGVSAARRIFVILEQPAPHLHMDGYQPAISLQAPFT